MYDISMNAHMTEAGCNRNRLVRNEPDLGSLIGLHGKTRRRADSTHIRLRERRNDPVSGFIDVIGSMVKLDIGYGSACAPNGLAIHAADETDERFGSWKEAEDLGALISELGPIDLNETCVVGAGVEADLPQPGRIENGRRPFRRPLTSARPIFFDGWMFRQCCHSSSFQCIYNERAKKMF
jgi:hypothetical protein